LEEFEMSIEAAYAAAATEFENQGVDLCNVCIDPPPAMEEEEEEEEEEVAAFRKGDEVVMVNLSAAAAALIGKRAKVIGGLNEKGRYPVLVKEGERKGKKITLKPETMMRQGAPGAVREKEMGEKEIACGSHCRRRQRRRVVVLSGVQLGEMRAVCAISGSVPATDVLKLTPPAAAASAASAGAGSKGDASGDRSYVGSSPVLLELVEGGWLPPDEAPVFRTDKAGMEGRDVHGGTTDPLCRVLVSPAPQTTDTPAVQSALVQSATSPPGDMHAPPPPIAVLVCAPTADLSQHLEERFWRCLCSLRNALTPTASPLGGGTINGAIDGADCSFGDGAALEAAGGGAAGVSMGVLPGGGQTELLWAAALHEQSKQAHAAQDDEDHGGGGDGEQKGGGAWCNGNSTTLLYRPLVLRKFADCMEAVVLQLGVNMGDPPHTALDRVSRRVQQGKRQWRREQRQGKQQQDKQQQSGFVDGATPVVDDWAAKMGVLRHAVGVVEMLMMVDQVVINKRRNLDKQ
jgi:hypothetical protein